MTCVLCTCLLAVQEHTIQRKRTYTRIPKHACRRPQTHWDVLILRLDQQPAGRSQVMILQGRLVIVGDGQRVMRLDEEVVVEAAMLMIMHHG